jgi:hypothetical protein
MKTVLALLIFALVEGGVGPTEVVAQAQKECPPEVAQAQTALKSAQAAAKSKATTKGPRTSRPRARRPVRGLRT